MIISFIVAAGEDNAIGIGMELPWNLPKDMKFFKQTTIGKPVIMGSKTFEALGKALPGRLNIVLSRDSQIAVPEGVLVYDSIDKALARLDEEANITEAFIIGGGKIFAATLDKVDCIYITRVHSTFPKADVFFPELDHTHWKLVWEEAHQADEQHAQAFTFQKFERIVL